MGCGSSTAQGGAVAEAAPPQQEQEQQAEKQPQQADKQGEAGGKQRREAEAEPEPKKKLLSRESSEDAAPPPAGATSATQCELDGSHVAAVWCAQCEQHFCAACDDRAHKSSSRLAAHRRTWLSSGAARENGQSEPPPAQQRKKGKFVLRAPVAGAESSGGEDPPRAKFVVGKFAAAPAHADSAAPAPSAATDSPSAAPVGASPTMQSDSRLQSDSPLQQHGNLSDALTRAPTRVNMLSHLSEEQLANLSHGEVEALWGRYDKDRNGRLSRSELKLLSDEVVERMMQLVRDDLRRNNPGLSEEELARRTEQEKQFVLPGKNEKETAVEMKRRLYNCLDVNQDGKITKQEFIMQWRRFAKEQFELEEKGELSCSIM